MRYLLLNDAVDEITKKIEGGQAIFYMIMGEELILTLMWLSNWTAYVGSVNVGDDSLLVFKSGNIPNVQDMSPEHDAYRRMTTPGVRVIVTVQE